MRNTVLCAHCLRRDSGWSTPTQSPIQDFPTLSLDHTPLLVRPHKHSRRGTSTHPKIPFRSHSRGCSAPLRTEGPPRPQGLISVSEMEAKSPGAQCRIQIGIICGLCTFLGMRPHTRSGGACLIGENRQTKGVCV